VNADHNFTMPNAAVTCVVTNTAVQGQVTLVKKWVGSIAGDTSVITIAGGNSPANATSTTTGGNFTDGGHIATAQVSSGKTVTLSEALGGSNKAAYTADYHCDGATVDPTTHTFTMVATSVDCTVTNTGDTGNLTLVKKVTAGFGGTAKATDWTLTATGPSTLSGQTGVNGLVVAGNYSLTESGPTGYQQSSLVCVDANGATVPSSPTLNLKTGADVTCTYTNDPVAPKLTLVKDVENGNTGSDKTSADWTLTATPTFQGFHAVTGNGTGDSSKGGVQNEQIWAGEYTLSENPDPGAGYEAQGWSCPGAQVDPQNPDAFTFPLGSDITCTITNVAKQSTLTVIKNVVNGNTGGTKVATDWTLTATGPTTISGAGTTGQREVEVGDYNLSETGPGPADGYVPTDLTCTADGATIPGPSLGDQSVHVDLGENVVCTYTNTAQPGQWTIAKTSDKGLTVQPGDVITYTLTLQHVGGVLAPIDLSDIDNLSQVQMNATFVPGSLKASFGTVTPYDPANPNVSWNLGAPPSAGPFTLTYQFKVNPTAWGVQLKNALTLPPNVTCAEGNTCSTESDTPDLDIWKTADPASGTDVLPGTIITYTLNASNYTKVDLAAGQKETDDLSALTPYATVQVPLTDPALSYNGSNTITWTLPAVPAGQVVTASFSVVVKDNAFGGNVVNTLVPGDVGNCPPVEHDDPAIPDGASCTTTNHVPDVDMSMVKTDDLDGAAVDSGKNDPINYTLTVNNNGTDPATGVVVTDPMPKGLTLDTANITVSGDTTAGDWDFSASTATNFTATYLGASYAPGTETQFHLPATVGTLDRPNIGDQFPAIENTACVTNDENPDSDPSNDCSTDTTKVKSIAVDADAICKANAPLVSYSITPVNVSADPTIALIWWTTSGYANRNPNIDASDKAALLADGAQQVDYITVPAGWQNGDTITGTQLWPGAALGPDGQANAWPGWTLQSDGTWVLDPNAPFYDLRGSAVVEVRINPSTASTEVYPPATPDCNPNPVNKPKASSPLADTGSNVAPFLGISALLLAGGAGLLVWMRRRRMGDGTEI
jgi:uncharacterized repeat protein (TIGR01451 family)/LPXTG-motif cell wall-anchored protein